MKNKEQQLFKSAPKISKVEAEYSGQEKKVDNLSEKIKKNLDRENRERENKMSEQDKIRLTRVLQLLEKYKPNRKIAEPDKNFLDYLKSLYRFIPKREDKKAEKKDNPYLLAEETVEALRALRHCDQYLKEFSDDFLAENKILDQEMSGEIKSSEVLETSLTMEYEKKNWGVNRICLDGIQNHLKSDSGGERTWVQCLIGQEWVSLEEAKNNKEEIKSVRFADDGVGFDVKNLVLFWSTKSQEQESKGQFGEGMKMIAASSVREGLDMELQSQNWSAKPFSKDIEVANTRKNTIQKVGQLAFNVDHHAQENIIGSRTIFHKPSKEFIDEVLKLEDKVLELEDNYNPLFSSKNGQIVRKESGDIFVKGIFVKNADTIFSYNFDDVETNRDRNSVNINLESRIINIISELNDKRLIKTFLQKSLGNERAIELDYYINAEYPSLWKEAFYEAFGKDACLDTNFIPPNIFKENKAQKVKLPYRLIRMLTEAGVKTDKETIPAYYQETIPTSVTLEYGKDVWNEERIMLDAIQNHLPKDAEGGSIYLRFETKDGAWHEFSELSSADNEDIKTIKIANSGKRGYDHRLLGIFQSMKDHDESSGKWGEGLKMLSSACLRNGIDMSLKSRDWRATPKVQEQEIDDKKIEQLVFEVVHEIQKGTISDNDSHSDYEQSSTTFNEPSLKLILEFREANKKVLAIEQKKPLAKTNEGEILRLADGELFVRDILIPGDHNLRYSYHFPKFDIKTRDRNAITRSDLQGALANLWSEVENPDAIKDYLYQAKLSVENRTNEESVEFQTYFSPKQPDLWIENFKNIFGSETAIRDVNSQDYNEFHQLEHVGLNMITMPTAVCDMLKNLYGKDGERISNYSEKIKELTDVDFIKNEDLSPEEKTLIESLYGFDRFMPGSVRNEINVYVKKFENQSTASGFTDHRTISLRRDTLRNFYTALDVYFHEKTHVVTGAKDAEAGFRNYLTAAMARVAMEMFEKENNHSPKKANLEKAEVLN